MLKVCRHRHGPDSTFGAMFIDDHYECSTLENSHLIIPAGLYEFEMYNSPKNKRIVPLLKNVPGRSEIEIHIANYWHELEGCIAVGRRFNSVMLSESALAFDQLMSKISKENQILIVETEL